MKSSVRVIYRMSALFSLVFFTAVIAFSQTSWRGTTSTSWGTVSNWTSGIPTAGVDAIIGDANFTGANQPTVNVAAACKTLTIGSGVKASTLTVSSNLTVSGGVTIGSSGTITHSSGVTLSLTGNWSNSGTYSATTNAATVTFAGAAQSLTGATTFRTMTINAGSTLTLNSAITVNRPLTVTGTLDPGTALVTLNNNFVVNSGAKIRVNTALYGSNYSINPTTLSGGSTVEYSSSTTNQILNNGVTYGTLLISGSMTKFLAGNLPSLNSTSAANGNILVTGGTLDLLSFTANRGITVAGGTLSVSNGAALKIGGTNSLPANYATRSFASSSTIEFNGTTQSVAAGTYGNVTLSSAGNKTAAGAMNIAGNFSLSNGTFVGGNFTHNVSGNWTMSSGNFTNTGTTISIIGGSVHNVSSTGAFRNLTVNAAGGSVVAGSDITVSGTLGLTAGIITTGVNKVILPPLGSVTRTSGHVNGYLQKDAPVGPTSLTFEVGDAASYAPVDIAFSNVTGAGGLVVSTTAGDHPLIGASYLDPTKDANRYWTMTGAGVGFTSYDITLHFLSGDLDVGANTSNFKVNKYNIPTWYPETTGTRTSTSTQALGLTTFCDFAVGEAQIYIISSNAGPNGSISPSGSIAVSSGSNQSFTITAATGYHIADVMVDGSSVGAVASYDFLAVTANHTIAASFAVDQFTITATAGANGTLTPNGAVLVNYGSDQSFTVTPVTGYHVDSVLVDGVDQGPVGSYSFTNVTANHSIRTVYAIDQFTITATEGSNGTLTPNGSVSVNYGSDQGFIVTANTGYHIDSVLVDGVDQGPVGSYSFTNVTTNHTIRTVYAINQLTITSTAGANGTLTPNGAVLVNYGSDQSFTITPNAGYHVDSVLVDGVDQGPVGSYSFTNVTANHSIRTVYAIDQFTITATEGSNGTLTPNGAVLVNYGSDQSFTITPNAGYHVDSVLIDGVDQGPVGSYSFTNVTANHSIRTVYAIDQFTITATTGSNGTMTPVGSVVVDYGTDQSFTITPNTGYYIADVQVDSVSVGQVANYTFTNVTANHTIHATFAITQYTINASAGSNGSISPNGAVLADHGASQGFTITPNTGYYVADVQVDSVSVGQVTSYTFNNVTANHTIHATFAITQYTISATAGSNGIIAPGGSVVLDYGSDQAFTITPNTGYYVADVQVDSVSVGQVTSYTFNNVTANHTIHASFAITQYTINASAGTNGSIAPSGAVLVDHGSSQGFTVTANTGYYVADVQVDSVSVGQVANYTFTNVTANHTIHATFAITEFTIMATAGANGSISPSGSVGESYGSDQNFTITPNTGYYVADVQVDSVSVGPVTSYTFNNVTANHTIHATFAITQYTVNAVAGSHGTITPAGPTAANYGDSLAYTITPDNGYYIADVQVDTVSVGAVTHYTFMNISANHMISASFALNPNNAPTAARLLLPASGDTLVFENLGPAVGFAWRASSDADVADALTYSIHLSGPGIDSVMAGLTDTTLQWGISSMLQSGGSYWWTVNVTDGQAVTASPDTFTFHVTSLLAVGDAGKDMPKSYALFQNFPNPFNPTTVVQFDLPRASEVRITVYNMVGQEVAVLINQTSMGAGHHEVSMDGGALSSGVYLYRIIAKAEGGDVFSSVKKMVLVK